MDLKFVYTHGSQRNINKLTFNLNLLKQINDEIYPVEIWNEKQTNTMYANIVRKWNYFQKKGLRRPSQAFSKGRSAHFNNRIVLMKKVNKYGTPENKHEWRVIYYWYDDSTNELNKIIEGGREYLEGKTDEYDKGVWGDSTKTYYMPML